jgi:hypothetical protein
MMAEVSYFWDGAVTGDATQAPYNDDEYSDVIRDILTQDRTVQGVLRSSLSGYSGNLAVTNPSGYTVRIASGIALVDGKLYRNSANIDETASTGGRYYRAVLTKDFTAYTVRADLLGPSTTVPSLTQNDGVQWDIPLATIYNNGSSLEITDERVFIPRIFTGNIEDDAVTTAKIEDGSITSAKIASGAHGMELIERITTTADATQVRFSGIAATYANLRIVASVRGAGTGLYLYMNFNLDTGNNYNWLYSRIGDTTTVYATQQNAQASFSIGTTHDDRVPSITFSPVNIDIPDYAGAYYKSYIAHNSRVMGDIVTPRGVEGQSGGYWASVAAITSIELTHESNFAPGCVFSLYGMS